MKMLQSMLVIPTVVLVVGCSAHLQANYPPNPGLPDLPDSWEHRGQRQPMLWDGEGFRVFFAQWDDLEIALKKAEEVAALGSTVAAQDAREIAPLVKQGLVGLRLGFFFREGKLEVKRSTLLIEFANGDVIEDDGAIYWEQNRGASAAKHKSREKDLLLDRRLRPRGHPLLVMVLVPRSYLGMGVVSIRLKGGE